MASTLHLTRRFLGSLRPGGPPATERDWVRSQLSEAEFDLWCAMPGPDRRHSAAVARRVERALGAEATRPVVAAALLHDVGKIDARLRTYGRVAASLSGAMVGRDPDVIRAWCRAGGFTRRVGLYLRHPEIGGDRLALIGSDPITVTWTREHHLPRDDWTLPDAIASALHAADDD
jgi:hypothetical protein